MQRFVGAQHRLGDLSKTVRLETIDLFTVADPGVRPLTRNEARALRRVRSFDVPAVRGHITASHEDAFHDALVVFLRGRLGLELVPDDQRWALRKALLIDCAIPAPPDETTGDAMALQLYGRILAYDGIAQRTPAWELYFDAETRRREAGMEPMHLTSPFTVGIVAATYANCLMPAVGMPFWS
jgi:hypothetical protein